MKKLLVGLLVLGSFSTFAAEVCILESDSGAYGMRSVNCTIEADRDALALAGSASKGLKEAFKKGYKIKSSNNNGSGVEYLLIKN